jgi:hypothetical protein
MSQNVLETWDEWVMRHVQEAEARGRLTGMRRLLLSQGRTKFGPPPPEVESTIPSITDADRLQRLGQRLLEVNSWEELFAGDDPNSGATS